MAEGAGVVGGRTVFHLFALLPFLPLVISFLPPPPLPPPPSWQSSGIYFRNQQQKIMSESKYKQRALCFLQNAIIDFNSATGMGGNLLCGLLPNRVWVAAILPYAEYVILCKSALNRVWSSPKQDRVEWLSSSNVVLVHHIKWAKIWELFSLLSVNIKQCSWQDNIC